MQYIYDQLPPAVLHDFAELVLDPPSGLDRITLYTDGSYSQSHPDSAGWSVVVLGHKGDSCFLLDCEWGIVPVDPLEEGWTAAAHVDSKAAETQGLIRAIEWCFRNWQPILHVFCFDSGFA